MTDSISQAIEAICDIVPARRGDSRNAALVRRLELLLQVATTMADTIPDNGGLSLADALELTNRARVAAARIEARAWPPEIPPPFQGFNLPRCTEAALEAHR